MACGAAGILALFPFSCSRRGWSRARPICLPSSGDSPAEAALVMSCLNSSLPRQPYSQAVLVGVGSEEDSPPVFPADRAACGCEVGGARGVSLQLVWVLVLPPRCPTVHGCQTWVGCSSAEG